MKFALRHFLRGGLLALLCTATVLHAAPATAQYIPEDKIAYVFDRFYQVKGKDDRGLKGTGLGLSICKSIVELHGGKIGVFAGEDGGCVFWFTLPLMKEEA